MIYFNTGEEYLKCYSFNDLLVVRDESLLRVVIIDSLLNQGGDSSGKGLLEDVKSDSSKRIKTTGGILFKLHWQNGYGAFLLPDKLDGVINYIDNQKHHHAKVSFQDEYRAKLKKFNVDYDERYVWD